MLVAKRVWKEKISKADFKDILGFLNHYDGIAELADGRISSLALTFHWSPIRVLQWGTWIHVQRLSFVG